jgi:hypothetical protein
MPAGMPAWSITIRQRSGDCRQVISGDGVWWCGSSGGRRQTGGGEQGDRRPWRRGSSGVRSARHEI